MNEIDIIIKKLKDAKPVLENEFFVTEIGVFGSYIRNEQTTDSDIDLLLDFKRGMTLFKLVNLKEYLENLLNKPVDIADKQTLKPRIGKNILSEVIYI